MKKDDWGLFLFISLIGYVLFMNKKEVVDFVEEKISGINDSFDSIFKSVGGSLGISAKTIKALAAAESTVGKNKSTEKIGDTKGIMQITYDTAKRFIPGLQPGQHKTLTPEQDIEIGAKYLNYLLKRYGKLEYAIMAYNGGEGRMDQIVRYEKTKVFVPLKVKPGHPPDTLEKMNAAYKNMKTEWAHYQANYNKLGIA